MEILMEYVIQSDKLDNTFQTSIEYLSMVNENVITDTISSVKEAIHKMLKGFNGFCSQKKEILNLYKTKKELNKKIAYVNRLLKKNPSLGNETIVIRGYNGKIMNPDLQEEIQFLKNMMANVKTKYTDKDVYYFFTQYMMSRSGWDNFYKIKISAIPELYVEVTKSIDKEIDELESTLYDFSKYLETANEIENKLNVFTAVINGIQHTLSRRIDILTMNLEVIQYNIGEAVNKLVHKKLTKVVVTPKDDKKIIEGAEKVKTITYGDETYDIYKTKYKNISCMNYGGFNIYVDNEFFDMPRGYQLAILYHEIGHQQCQHFKPKDMNKPITVEDEEKLMKRIKADMHMFYYYVNNYSMFRSDDYRDGTELIYLLTEWDADRFAAKQIGKSLVRSALTTRFNNMLDSDKHMSDPKNRKIKEYNKDRMRVRTSLI